MEIITKQFFRPPDTRVGGELHKCDYSILIAKGNVGGRLILLDEGDNTSYFRMYSFLRQKGLFLPRILILNFISR